MNQYGMNSYQGIIDVPREETASLLAKVLAITAFGFLMTAAGVATAPPWGMFVGMIAVLGLVFAINFARKSSPGLALGLFIALSYFMGWEIAPIIHRYVATIGSQVVFQAAATTGFGMAAMGCFAYLFQINYRKIAGIGFAGASSADAGWAGFDVLPLPYAGHVFVADAWGVYPPDRRRLRSHPGGWRWALGGLARPLDLPGRDQYLSCGAAVDGWSTEPGLGGVPPPRGGYFC